MLVLLSTIINPETVATRTYFLQGMTTPWILWVIRAGFLMLGLFLLLVYKRMKKGNGE